MSFRITTLIWMASLSIAYFGVYVVKYTVEGLERNAVAMRAEVNKEHEALHLLNAEWAYLNRPERLRKLAETHLALQPIDSRQINEIKLLPAAFDPPAATAEDAQPLFQPVAAGAR